MKFNPEINLGTVIEIAVFVLTVLGAARKFGELETKVNMLYDYWISSRHEHARHSEGD